jgi:CRISPR type IV-associated protein Csf2
MAKGKLFDMGKEFGEGSQKGGSKQSSKSNTKEINVQKTLNITAKTVTPLHQTAPSGSQRRRFIYENGERGSVPFFSANGLRGAIRRIATRQQVEAAKRIDPDFSKKVTPEIFYLYTSGAGLSSISVETVVTPENETQIRADHPILSVFGAGLSGLPGKLAVADLFPSSDTELFIETEKGRFPAILGSNTFFRVDSIRNSGLWRGVLDVEEIQKWRDEYTELVIAGKQKKSDDGEEKAKEENSHIQQPVEIDFIIPGVTLTSSISGLYGDDSLTDVELGMVLSALKELSRHQIGAHRRIGFGVLDWTVESSGEVLFRTTSAPDYVLDRTTVVTEAGQKLIDAWEDWLKDNATKMVNFGAE